MQLTINDITYDSDTFNDKQKEILNTLTLNSDVMRITKHQLECMSAVGNNLTIQLETSLKETETSDTKS